MIKLIPENSRYVGKTAQGRNIIMAQLISDTCAELAGVTEADGQVCGFGSIALAVTDGELCVLDSSGIWHKQSNGAAVTQGNA